MEKKLSVKNFIVPAVLFVVFAVFTVLVKTVDVGEGRMGTELGFATFNLAVEKIIPFNNGWYMLSEILGYAAIGVCLGFACFGLYEMIKYGIIKKQGIFKAVDKEIWILAGFYVVVIGFYVLFEKFEINYRPVILDEGLEASYPSSHTMLAICVFCSAVIMFDKFLKKTKIFKAVGQGFCVIFAALTVVGRFFSGVHWATDIIGGLLISAALVSLFVAVIKPFLQETKVSEEK